MPLYLLGLRLPIKTALACSLAVAAALAVPGTIVHAALGHIDWAVTVVFAVSLIPMSRLGARTALRLRPERLERVYGAALLTLGVDLPASSADDAPRGAWRTLGLAAPDSAQRDHQERGHRHDGGAQRQRREVAQLRRRRSTIAPDARRLAARDADREQDAAEHEHDDAEGRTARHAVDHRDAPGDRDAGGDERQARASPRQRRALEGEARRQTRGGSGATPSASLISWSCRTR